MMTRSLAITIRWELNNVSMLVGVKGGVPSLSTLDTVIAGYHPDFAWLARLVSIAFDLAGPTAITGLGEAL
jgi:hypothetical protein